MISYGMLLAAGLISFFLAHLSSDSNETVIILDLIVGMTLLLLIVIIYFAYERRGNDSNSGLINLAVLPYKFEDLIFWAGYISTVGFILALILAPSHILLISGFGFSIVGLVLSSIFDKYPGSVVRERRKTLDDGQEHSSYQLTQLNYCFLYTFVGLSFLIAGIVLGIARFSA